MNLALWMLGVSGFALSFSTGLLVPALLWLIVWLIALLRKPTLRLQKWWVYGAVVPFSFWFVIAPTAGVPRVAGMTAWLFWIAAWYFQGLGMVQLLTLNRGGERRFIWWNSAMALGVAAINPTPLLQGCLLVWVLLWLLDLHRASILRPLRLATVVAWLTALMIVLGINLAYQHWQNELWDFQFRHSHWNGSHSQVKGFEPTSWLGRFSSEYDASVESQIALQVYSSERPIFMRGMVQESYAFGIWRMAPMNILKNARGNYLEYGRFDFDDTTTPQIWVQPMLPSLGCLFTQLGSHGLAVVADTLVSNLDNAWQAKESVAEHGYFLDEHRYPEMHRVPHDLDVNAGLFRLLDSAWLLVDSTQTAKEPAQKVAALTSWFRKDFSYDLLVDVNSHEDPLRTFFRTRRGYCEYFATLATLMLRRAQVPARYVVGYAYPEHEGDAWVFRRGNAHAWVEFYVGEQGWVTFDPTPPSFVHVTQPTFWGQKISERIFEKIHLWQHHLRDGSWKLAVDHFSDWGANWIRSMQAKMMFGLLTLLALLLWARRKSFVRNNVRAAQRLLWVIELERTEKKLSRQGYARLPSETVYHWLLRLPKDTDAALLHSLQEYQAHRFERTMDL